MVGAGPRYMPEVEQCIADCMDCARVCQETVRYCLQMGGNHTEPRLLTLLMDCAAMCELSESMMLRDSSFQVSICTLCTEVCQRCADSCERFTGDAQMQRCADTCRRCAASCRRMVTAMEGVMAVP